MVLVDLQSSLASLEVQYRLQVPHFQNYLFLCTLFPPQLTPHASPSCQANQALPPPLSVQCSLGLSNLAPRGLPRPWQKNPQRCCRGKRLVLLSHLIRLQSHLRECVHYGVSSLCRLLLLPLLLSVWTLSPSVRVPCMLQWQFLYTLVTCTACRYFSASWLLVFSNLVVGFQQFGCAVSIIWLLGLTSYLTHLQQVSNGCITGGTDTITCSTAATIVDE